MTIAITFSNGSDYHEVRQTQYEGVLQSNPLDYVSSSSFPSGTSSTFSIATNNGGDWIVMGSQNNGGFQPSSCLNCDIHSVMTGQSTAVSDSSSTGSFLLSIRWGSAAASNAIIAAFRSARVTELSGTITTSTTWVFTGAPYIVTSTVTIATGTTVTVEKGVIIKFKDNQSLVVNGTLNVQGTSSTLTYFTSYHDDSVGGDTNGDATSTSPAAGQWGNIEIGTGASSTLAGSVVRYGGVSSTMSDANLYNNGGTLTVRYADISYSDHFGIKVASGTTTVTDAQIHNHTDGIGITGGTITIASSSIFNNTVYNALQSNAPTSTMTGNFWGGWNATNTSQTAPYNPSSNPGGLSGTDVSDYVDYSSYVVAYLFDPANTAFPTSTAVPSAVNVDVNPFEMRVGGFSQYVSSTVEAISGWNAATSSLINFINASSSPTSSLNLVFATTSEACSYPNGGCWWGRWNASTTPPSILLNTYSMDRASSTARIMAIMHEMGHSIGLAHSTSGNVMIGGQGATDQTYLGPQDYHDYNFRWGNWWAGIWSRMLKK